MSTVVTSERHAEMTVKPYLIIFVALAIFTAVSFVVGSAERADGIFGRALIDAGTGFVIVLGVAVVKALLVALFFMHLFFDWRRVYLIILPALVLATVLVLALWPDMVLAWHATN